MEFKSFVAISMVLCGLLYMNFELPVTAAILLQNDTDYIALKAFKAAITVDPLGVLSSWNDSNHFCDWVGISCSNLHKERVLSLNLYDQKLGGLVSPYIGNLSFLRMLNLSNNFFRGEIPNELGRLFRLQRLDFENNTFQGEIPANLSYCSDLRYIDLGGNELQGRIPNQLGSLQRLVALFLFQNTLTGSIPTSLGNLSYLLSLNIEMNNLEGMIPPDLARLQLLKLFGVGYNQLNGTIPPQLYNLSNLYIFSVGGNNIKGSLPWDTGLTLPNLEWLDVGGNQLTGAIPVSLVNCSELAVVILSNSSFSGSVPHDLGKLQNLFRFGAWDNNFGTSEGDDLLFLTSLTNCTNLETIAIAGNSLRGSLPTSLGNLSSQLEILDLGSNHIHGSIPSGIGDLVNLRIFILQQNSITGRIPNAMGKLQQLQLFNLSNNNLTGEIPLLLGNLTTLNHLGLSHNKFGGSIPSSLANCQNLLSLDLSYNNLIGTIPVKLFNLSSLSIGLSLAHNAFVGPLPLQVSELNNLGRLDVSGNILSGRIPQTLAECNSLVELYMNGNKFEGLIPDSLSALKGIEILDLSHNNLTGMIPEFLGKLPFLSSLNLSFNNLEGPVSSTGILRNASVFKVDGNPKLCGGSSELRLPVCLTSASKRKQKPLSSRVITSVLIAGVCLVALASFMLIVSNVRKSMKKSSTSLSDHRQFRISYVELVKATNSFCEDNLLGVGTYGYVYKGILEQDGTVVAVKVFNLQQLGGSNSFISECKALRNVRHRNLVKTLTSCSSVDFKGNDFKALVYELMPNGSLEKWLHPASEEKLESRNLNLIQRLNISIDVALALDYLHNHSQSTIVHCDVKPSNVLLDSELTAHVGDFGLAKIISSISDDFERSHTSSLAVKGTIGYVAPEYGVGSEVSTQGDVYSYGILLLEIFTGKRPTDDMFNDGLNLHGFVDMSLPERVLDIVDPRLLAEPYTEGRSRECLAAVLEVGVGCSVESSRDRMLMGDVVLELSSIRDFYRGAGVQGERRNGSSTAGL